MGLCRAGGPEVQNREKLVRDLIGKFGKFRIVESDPAETILASVRIDPVGTILARPEGKLEEESPLKESLQVSYHPWKTKVRRVGIVI